MTLSKELLKKRDTVSTVPALLLKGDVFSLRTHFKGIDVVESKVAETQHALRAVLGGAPDPKVAEFFRRGVKGVLRSPAPAKPKMKEARPALGM